MHISFKKSIRSKLLSVAPAFSMSEIVFPSFVRNQGYKATISASDAVYGLTSLLECGGIISLEKNFLFQYFKLFTFHTRASADWMRRHAGGTGFAQLTASSIKSIGSNAEKNPSTNESGSSSTAVSVLAGVGVGMRQGAAAVSVHVSEFDTGIGSKSAMKSNSDDFTSLSHDSHQGNTYFEDDEPPVEGESEHEAREREMRNRKRDRDRETIKNFYMAYDALDKLVAIFYCIHLIY